MNVNQNTQVRRSGRDNVSCIRRIPSSTFLSRSSVALAERKSLSIFRISVRALVGDTWSKAFLNFSSDAALAHSLTAIFPSIHAWANSGSCVNSLIGMVSWTNKQLSNTHHLHKHE